MNDKITINPFEHPREPQMLNVEIVALNSDGEEVSDRTPAVMVVDYGPGEIKWGLLNKIEIRIRTNDTTYSGLRVYDAETGEVLVDPNMEGY